MSSTTEDNQSCNKTNTETKIRKSPCSSSSNAWR